MTEKSGMHAVRMLVTALLCLSLAGCLGMPDQVTPVTGFDKERYLGTWYEIARLDHSFERGLSHVRAEYGLRDDGGLSVRNTGFDNEDGEWSQAEGKAYFVGDADTAHLKVSFFGPFYGSYVVFELDEDYQYAFVSGNSHDYLWLLARTPTVPDAVFQRFREQALARGFDLSGLVRVVHTPDAPCPQTDAVRHIC
ncbi:MAG: lipocalin family protein [Alcanivoracaceae bacterium]|nr:lipocalin family protein [Alcanivoracaceae bacterium]